MPKRNDLKKILILGSGPIVIGQACEFDYSGTQACKALMKEGFEVILVNSNPATIMTDPEIATRVYVEPLKVSFIEKIIKLEKPQAIIPTLGGQVALNLALELSDLGILKKYNIELLGANPDVIRAAEDREKFRDILDQVGARYPASEMVRTFEQGMAAAEKLGFPLVLRPNYTLGGGGGGIAYTLEDYQKMIVMGLSESPTSEVLVEASILGWKEYELEVMRDARGTFVVVCTIENLDPCGVHTGDSITVAPQQTLSDQAYQAMRDEACKILNKVGVETGGANIQFAVNPANGERVVIEMNPRVSRSSALASKATGFPIAKIAALLAVGYHLDEIPNDITRVTPSCYEPALDYVVVKIPRFAFEKFAGVKDHLTTQMKSVGEVMAIGRTFQESLMKALQSMEGSAEGIPTVALEISKLSYPNSHRIFHLFQAFRDGLSIFEIQRLTQIDFWFLEQIDSLVKCEKEISRHSSNWMQTSPDELRLFKRKGFSDSRIAKLWKTSVEDVKSLRESLKIFPHFLSVDTCAGEFESKTPYFYSTYWHSKSPGQVSFSLKNSIVVLGAGPNRIGQGIEFDYSCVRGVKALQKENAKVVMINSNPETVSTDYDTADALFFEPMTEEAVLEVLRWIKPRGFIAQLGGQTAINLAQPLVKEGFQLLGSSLLSIDLAEDRSRFSKICKELGLSIPESGLAANSEEALKLSQKLGFPLMCRPSYVLGGRRMEVVESESELRDYFIRNKDYITSESPCFIDCFLEGALEVDVDVVRAATWKVIGGILEHIEAAGVHSGDSMGVLPPQRLKVSTRDRIEVLASQVADRLNVVGLLNLQLAIKDDIIYVIEANPRSSRSVPFIAKATAIPIIDLGIKAILGMTQEQVQPGQFDWRKTKEVSVKGVVFPFRKFREADSILGPEMKSTGESMGRGAEFSEALMKAMISSQMTFPEQGEVFFSARDKDKPLMLTIAQELLKNGFKISGTKGTAQYFIDHGLPATVLRKVHEGRPHCVDRIRSGAVTLVINTVRGKTSIEASFDIRRACIDQSIPCITESDAAEAFMLALAQFRTGTFEVKALPIVEQKTFGVFEKTLETRQP